MSLRSVAATVVPLPIRRGLNRIAADRAQRRIGRLETPQIFETIYSEGHWGRRPDGLVSSGLGSHDETIVGPYVEAVRGYLETLPEAPVAVDLGCGDFNVGSRVLDRCSGYVACDVARNVIEQDREQFRALDVDFRVLDMVTEPLPAGDVVFVRQVLQHLSNEQIALVLPKLRSFRAAIITEHLPPENGFTPNVDIETGIKIRAAVGSGVVLEEPPFSFTGVDSEVLCVVDHETGSIVTTVYRFV